MSKITTLAIAFSFASLQIHAQIITVQNGTSLTIQSGASFYANGLTLTPSADFTITNVTLTRNNTITNPSYNTSINRAYKFSATTPAFSGTVRIDYQDAELNGLSEPPLQVNIHNGVSWAAYASATNDVTNNYVVSTAISSVALNELTLASSLGTLPLVWLSFTAQK